MTLCWGVAESICTWGANNKITKIDTKGRGYLQEECSSMITESRIDHLRSLVKRGRNYERPNWDIVEIITSGGVPLFFFV